MFIAGREILFIENVHQELRLAWGFRTAALILTWNKIRIERENNLNNLRHVYCPGGYSVYINIYVKNPGFPCAYRQGCEICIEPGITSQKENIPGRISWVVTEISNTV